jgi:hypothetical protein
MIDPYDIGTMELPLGVPARNAWMSRFLANGGRWAEAAMSIIGGLPLGWRGTGEDIRGRVTEAIGEPHDLGVWCALINQAIGRNWIRPTGRVHQPKDHRSYARTTYEYVRTSRYA